MLDLNQEENVELIIKSDDRSEPKVYNEFNVLNDLGKYELGELKLSKSERFYKIKIDRDNIADLNSPLQYSLNQNYPNPFNPKTTISFTLPQSGKVKLAVYNVKGRKVNTLVNQELKSGNHKIEWNGKNSHGYSVSSGIYFYRLITQEGVLNKKMLLLK